MSIKAHEQTPARMLARVTTGGEVMRLSSMAFSKRSAIPQRFSCDVDDMSPPLEWSDAPAGTRSFVLLAGDPDAPSGSFHHWGACDIVADTAALAPSVSGEAEEAGFKQAINDFQRPGYGGPCPPRGHPPHHHHFRLLALSADRLSFRRNPACLDVEREARKHALAGAVLVGLQQR